MDEELKVMASKIEHLAFLNIVLVKVYAKGNLNRGQHTETII